jgi:HEAT repeat protein
LNGEEAAMKTGDPSMIILSLDVLGRIRSEAAQELIRQYTNHGDRNVRRMAESALRGS